MDTTTVAHGVILEAEYEDGFVLNEHDLNDISPYDDDRNVFHAIINERAVPEHGRMVRWSCDATEFAGLRYDIDWTINWHLTNPRPIYFRDMERVADQATGDWIAPAHATRHVFGFQYNDAEGRNAEVVEEITPTASP